MRPRKSRETELREEAWVGDAVLGLYAREWILREKGQLDADLFRHFTSNQFLSGLGAGSPTVVEAEIGRIYHRDGLQAAFAYIEENVLPLLQKQVAR